MVAYLSKYLLVLTFIKLFYKAESEKIFKGPFNNYVDKMRGEGVKKCLFLSTLMV